MYDYISGSYIGNISDDWTKHFETTYYINYNIEKALYSLEKILTDNPDFIGFSSLCTYYHFYIDSLINALDNIHKRFSFNNRNDIDKKRVIRNIKEYNYATLDKNENVIKNNYQSFNNNVRNFVEHIDEKDEFLIKDKKFFGTFNVIYDGMDESVKSDLLSNEFFQNNLLNLINKTYRVYNNYDKKNNGERKYRVEELKLHFLIK